MPKNLLTRLAHALDEKKIPYMIIGGQAMLLYGEPRLTRDVDVTVGLTPEDLERIILAAVEQIDLHPLVPDVKSFVQRTWVLPTLGAKPGHPQQTQRTGGRRRRPRSGRPKGGFKRAGGWQTGLQEEEEPNRKTQKELYQQRRFSRSFALIFQADAFRFN